MNYLDLKVKEVIKETPDAISVVFERPAGVEFKAGQFLTLIMDINGKEVRRSYSLSSAPYEMDRLTVSVKRVEGGLMSNYLNDHTKAGDIIKVMEPLGTFVHEVNSAAANQYVLFGGGSGITPMMSILKTVLKEEPNSNITLVFANRDKESIIFREEIEALSTSSDKLKVIHVLEDNTGYDARSGRITPDLVKEVINSVSANGYYMCGPTGMMDAVTNSLNAYGVSSSLIHKESFVSATTQEHKTGAGNKVVKIIYEGDEFNVEVKEGSTILDSALDADVDLPYSCQGGVCTACRGKCISGQVDLSEVEGLSDAEMDQGYILTCVGYPLSDDVVIEIG